MTFLESVADAKIDAQVEIVHVEMLGEEAAVAGTEVELEGEGSFDLVLHTEDAVGTALAEIGTGVAEDKPSCTESVPTVADAAADADQSIEPLAEMALKHDVWGSIQNPRS